MSAPIYHLIPNAPKPVAPYSHVVEADGWLFVTGQLATDPDDDSLPLSEGIEAQTRKVMENLRIVLAHVGAGFEHVAQVRIFLTDFERDYAPMNAVYQSYFARYSGQSLTVLRSSERGPGDFIVTTALADCEV